MRQLMRIIKQPLISIVAFLLLWLTMIGTQINVDVNKDKYLDGFRDWTECLFTGYDGSDATMLKCGEHPRYHCTHLYVALLPQVGAMTRSHLAAVVLSNA
jgi:hypothetical protein